MKRFSSVIFIFFLISSFRGYAQDSTKYLTIKQCVDLAIQNNLQIQQSQIQLEQNGVLYKQSKDNLLPQINAQLSQGQNYGRSISNVDNSYVDQQFGQGNYGLNANLVLFNGLSLQNAIKQNSLYYNASKMDLQQQKDNITLSVVLSYLTVLSNQETLDIARRQAAVDSAQVARLEIQNKEGAIPPATLYDLKGQYASDLVNVVNAENALQTAKVNLFGCNSSAYHNHELHLKSDPFHRCRIVTKTELIDGPSRPFSIVTAQLPGRSLGHPSHCPVNGTAAGRPDPQCRA